METLPIDAEDVTAEWLTSVLGAEVTGVEVLGRTTATNMHLRIGVTYAEPGAGPASLFVKLPPLDPAHREAIGATGMGVREAQFYGDVAPVCGLRVPETFHTATAEDGSFLLLLEDLAARGCRFSDATWGVPAELAGAALDDLARFHVRFEDEAFRNATAPWSAAPRARGSEWAAGVMRWVLDERADQLTADYAAIGELFVAHHAELEVLWDQGPQTFIHGDPHIGNVFLDGDRVGFVDWGLARVGTALRDVSYFLTMTVDVEDRGRDDRALLLRYLDARVAAGGSALDPDEVWLAHRVQTGYTVVASFLGLTPTYDTEEGRPFATAFRERSFRAIEQLGTVEALQTALGR